jgi:hypothetical protein
MRAGLLVMAVALPLQLTMCIADQIGFLLMVMGVLFACSLSLLSGIVLLYPEVRSATYAIPTCSAKLIGCGGTHLQRDRSAI